MKTQTFWGEQLNEDCFGDTPGFIFLSVCQMTLFFGGGGGQWPRASRWNSVCWKAMYLSTWMNSKI